MWPWPSWPITTTTASNHLNFCAKPEGIPLQWSWGMIFKRPRMSFVRSQWPWSLITPQSKPKQFFLHSNWIFAPDLKWFPSGPSQDIVLTRPKPTEVIWRSTFDLWPLKSNQFFLESKEMFLANWKKLPWAIMSTSVWDGRTDRRMKGWTMWKHFASFLARKVQEVDSHGC